MAASDARPVPRKNAAWRLYLSFRKSDGTVITSWTGADTEVSLDGGAFADCTNEITEIGTSGSGYIDFTAAEMNADCVVIKSSITNTGALELRIPVYPEEAGDYRADVTHFGGSAGTFSGGRPEVNATHIGGTIQTAGDVYALLSAVAGYIDTEVAAIKAKTDNLPPDPADASDIAASFASIASTLSTIASYIDTEIAAIKAKTDNLPSDPADQSQIEAAITAAAITAAGIRSALGMASADLDTQLDAILAASGGGGGGGGLTTEQEATLNATYAFASQISGSRIAHVGPVLPGGDIELIKGKDYTVASDNVLPIAVPDTGGAMYADITSGTLAASKSFGARRDNGDATIAGTIHSVAYATNVTTINVEVAASQLPDSLTEGDDWTYMIQRTTDAGKNVVVAEGAFTVKARVV